MNFNFIYNGYCVIYAEFFPYDSHNCYVYGFHSIDEMLMSQIGPGIDINPIVSIEHPSWWIRNGFTCAVIFH